MGLIEAIFGGLAVAYRQQGPITPPPPVIEIAPPEAAIPVIDRPHFRGRNITKLTEEFVKWMRDEGGHGWRTVDEIDEMMDCYCDSQEIMCPDPNTARSQLMECAGVESARYRLKTKFPEIYAATGKERAVLYRIASHAEMAKNQKRRRSRMESAGVRHVASISPGRPMGVPDVKPKQKPNVKPKMTKKPIKSDEYQNLRDAA